MTLKYVVYTGSVTSKTDGQRHLLTEYQIALCYGVSLHDCMVIPYTVEGPMRGAMVARAIQLKLLPLVPRYHGDYKEHLEDLLRD